MRRNSEQYKPPGIYAVTKKRGFFHKETGAIINAELRNRLFQKSKSDKPRGGFQNEHLIYQLKSQQTWKHGEAGGAAAGWKQL